MDQDTERTNHEIILMRTDSLNREGFATASASAIFDYVPDPTNWEGFDYAVTSPFNL